MDLDNVAGNGIGGGGALPQVNAGGVGGFLFGAAGECGLERHINSRTAVHILVYWMDWPVKRIAKRPDVYNSEYESQTELSIKTDL